MQVLIDFDAETLRRLEAVAPGKVAQAVGVHPCGRDEGALGARRGAHASRVHGVTRRRARALRRVGLGAAPLRRLRSTAGDACSGREEEAREAASRSGAIAEDHALGTRDGLPKACAAKLDSVHLVPVVALGQRITTLRASRVVEVKRALGHALFWPELMSL